MIVPLIASVLAGASVLSSLPSAKELDQERSRVEMRKLLRKVLLGQVSTEYVVSRMVKAWPAVRAPWARFIATQWIDQLKKKTDKTNARNKKDAQSSWSRHRYTPSERVYASIYPVKGDTRLGIMVNEGGFDMKVTATLAHDQTSEVDVGFDTEPGQVVFDEDGLHLDPAVHEPFAKAIAKAFDAAANLDAWDRWRPSQDDAREVLLTTNGRRSFLWYYKLLETRSDGWSLTELVQEPAVRDHFLGLIGVENDQWERAASTWRADMSSSPAWMLPL